MQLLLVIVREERKEEVEAFLVRAGVGGYTELAHAAGAGTSGLRLGSAAFPGTSTVLLVLLEDGRVEALADQLRAHCAHCGDAVRMVSWAVQPVGIG